FFQAEDGIRDRNVTGVQTCALPIYKKTHTGARYSQSFVQTIIIMGVTVSVVMIVIGNNVAVAFGLVGAFSIIRFRSAMSDPKDKIGRASCRERAQITELARERDENT